jgi:hypothetical protein
MFSFRILAMDHPSSNLYNAGIMRAGFWRIEMGSRKKATMRKHSTG